MALFQKSFSVLLPDPIEIRLFNLEFQNGHTTIDEHQMIASLVAYFQPSLLLELGTFDGNTTAILAGNSPSCAKVHTIDLPQGYIPDPSIHPSNKKYILHDKRVKKYHDCACFSEKIVEHYGDTRSYDFSLFAKEGLLDFIFIDACHDYEFVKNDSEKSLNVLSKEGIILWHDFSPIWPGVQKYLLELSLKVPLIHIEGTSFVLFKSNSL